MSNSRAIIVVFLACSLEAAGEATVFESPEAFAFHDALLAWSHSLKSFSGTYTINQYWYGIPGRDPNMPKETQITYRFEGGNRYMEYCAMLKNPKEKDLVKVCFHVALYGGVITTREDFDKTKQRDPYSVADVGGKVAWPIPEGAYLSPDMIFQGDCWPSLEQFLSKGESSVSLRNGQWVLTHRFPYDSPERLDVWFDEQKRPKTFKYGYCVDVSKEELKSLYPGDPFDLFHLENSLELDNYVEINGTWFPTWVRKTWWEYENGKVSPELREAFGTGKISLPEYQVKRILVLGKLYVDSYQDCYINPQQVNINTPLSKADFEIEIPPGTLVSRDGDSRVYPYPGPWYWRVFNRWTGLVALVVVVGGGCAVVYIRTPKHRHHRKHR